MDYTLTWPDVFPDLTPILRPSPALTQHVPERKRLVRRLSKRQALLIGAATLALFNVPAILLH